MNTNICRLKSAALRRTQSGQRRFINLSSLSRRWQGLPILALVFFAAFRLLAGVPTPGSNPWLDSWSFADTNYWTSDLGYYPISFTNIGVTYDGPEKALLIDTNIEAWLQFNVYESSGATNLNIVSNGSLMFWYSPDWASASYTNVPGGTGPGVPGRLIEVGTTNGPNGWWCLYFGTNGNNVYFSCQDGMGNSTNYLSAAINFASNSWHLFTLDWTSTNTSLFVDGNCVAVGTGISVLPNTNVFTNGFTIGSDLASGMLQMNGSLGDLTTYNVDLDTNFVRTEWTLYGMFFAADAATLGNFTNVPYYPSFALGTLDVVSGQGFLQVIGTNTTSCAPTNNEVSIADVSSTTNTNSSINLFFMVAGGNPSWAYDVFGIGTLPKPITNGTWTWLGQAYSCQTNEIAGLTNTAAFLILGTPQDSDGDGLTDAYKLLVSHTSLSDPFTFDPYIPDTWKVLNQLSTTNSVANLDPDHDGLDNLQEYLYGTNPNVSQGLAIWVAQPNGTTGIP